jgi:large subunit ribosomal protein L30e
MADLTNDIRLAVDSGKTAIGLNTVISSIKENDAKVIIVATKNKEGNLQDLMHMANVAGIKVIPFEGNPVELGAVCGKPFSVSAVSVIEPGNSNILKDE